MSRKPPTGRRAVIIGNGPSVDGVPPAAWAAAQRAGWLLIGTNRALAFPALAGVGLDAMVMHDTPADLFADPSLAHLYHEEHWRPFVGWRVGPAAQRVAVCDEYARYSRRWEAVEQRDANGEAALLGGSTPAMACNWAFHRGARRIALIGCEYAGGGYASMRHPFGGARTSGATYAGAVEDCIERQFAMAVQGVECSGGRFVNCSPGAVLRSVPLATWKDFVTDAT